MKMNITYTPVSNVDQQQRCLIDNSLVDTKEFDWDEIVTIKDNSQEGKEKQIPVNQISLYDHELIIEETNYKPLRTLSK